MPGWSHKPICDRHLLSHWIHQNFTSKPACCFITFTFALHGFSAWLFKKTCRSWLLLQHWPVGRTVPNVPSDHWWETFTRMLLFCTILILIKALSQHLGILPLSNVSNPWQRVFYLNSFDAATNHYGQLFTCTTKQITIREFFSSQACSEHPSIIEP